MDLRGPVTFFHLSQYLEEFQVNNMFTTIIEVQKAASCLLTDDTYSVIKLVVRSFKAVLIQRKKCQHDTSINIC